jgi:hypothetical protein
MQEMMSLLDLLGAELRHRHIQHMQAHGFGDIGSQI